MIKFNQNAWLKPYIDINADLRKKAKKQFEKDFLSYWIMQVLEKLWKMLENRDTKLITTERRRNCLVSQWNYDTTNFFTENVLTIEMKKTEILINKPVYLGLSTVELSKMLMYEFWYYYVKLKCDEKAKLCYMDTDSLIVYIRRWYL